VTLFFLLRGDYLYNIHASSSIERKQVQLDGHESRISISQPVASIRHRIAEEGGDISSIEFSLPSFLPLSISPFFAHQGGGRNQWVVVKSLVGNYRESLVLWLTESAVSPMAAKRPLARKEVLFFPTNIRIFNLISSPLSLSSLSPYFK
jgi:hypothetical protein